MAESMGSADRLKEKHDGQSDGWCILGFEIWRLPAWNQ
jgi:hypothetical protein